MERRQDRWSKKAGYVSKSYKLKREVVEKFAKACDKAGVSKSSQLTKMMLKFVDEVEEKEIK